MKIEKIFFNEFGRLRSGWRFAIFLLLFVFFGVLFGYAAEFLLTKLAVDFSQGSALYILVNSFVAFEEMLFRGYIFQTLARAKLAWLAIALTSLFFAVAHLTNSNANYISTFNTALAGVWFGVAYLKTRTLWFVFGLHLAWNWFQGAVFGIEVSGIKSLTTAPLFQEIDSGPIWLTGESYGIEGGIACTFALTISILLIWFLPFLKPTGEMLALTDSEIPKQTIA
ncbi:MAG: CPBP family intramembrane metalloprotease [Acidobacteria bacterium]|nr:CPBP family intramembrane metalloprotease [Acidobacteriota bacterium]